jgi:hypothetical protein
MNRIHIGPKRILSARPVINAGVIIMNLALNKANNRNGMVSCKDQAVFGPTLERIR